MGKLIEIKNIKTHFYTEAGTVKAVEDVSFDIMKGEALGVVGESGSGKSVTSLSINRLIPNPPGEIVSGEILYKGTNLLDLSYQDMRRYRGNDIAMILDQHNIAIRTGHHCAQPLMKRFETESTARVSFGIYNNQNDVDCFIRAIDETKKFLK